MTREDREDVRVGWDRLVASAVLGTARAPLPPLDADGELGRLLRLATESEPAERVLSFGALLGQYRRAGFVAPPPNGAPLQSTPAPEADLPPCSARATRHVTQILTERPLLLPEWCRAAAAQGVRASDELLVLLLARAPSEPLVSSVLGARGEWLARQQPEWARLLEPTADLEQAWHTGQRAERLRALRRLRDGEPERGLSLVAATFAEESPEDRESIIVALSAGLSMADEPFLEQVLGDRRKAVRRAAASLLSRLPESRLAARAAARALPLLEFVPGKSSFFRKKKPELVVRLPEKHDPELERDGVEPKRDSGLGERAAILAQLIAATPLSAWPFSSEVEELISTALATEWSQALILGFLRAAGGQRRQDWAEALLSGCLGAADARIEGCHAEMGPALALLEPRAREALLLRAVEIDPSLEREQTRALFDAADHAWSMELSRAVFTALKRICKREPVVSWAVQNAVRDVYALRLLPSLHADAGEIATWGENNQKLVEDLLSTLRFRGEMLAELARR